MNVLIGDIGNTSTKVCLLDIKTFKIKKIIYFDSINISKESFLKRKFKKIINSKITIKNSLFSSVVPKYQVKLKKFLKRNYKINLREIKERNIKKTIRIDIKNKKQVGSDRIANAAGVYKKFKSNCIVLDFGTATTFDVVTRKGIYKGGIIAPGLKLSLNSLVKKADQIPNFLVKKQKKIIGTNTVEALRSGFYWGYSGLINNIILKIEKETNKKYKIIFTGGYANLFKTSIIRPFRIDKNITIKGIIEIFKANMNQFNK